MQSKLKWPFMCYDSVFKSVFMDNENILSKMICDISGFNYALLENNLVLDTNADSINGNVYTWRFDRNNYHKNIYLKASSVKKNSSGSPSEKPSNPDNPDDPVDSDDPDDPEDPDDPGEVEKPSNPGIHRTTVEDPNAEEKAKYIWIIIPLAILGFLVVIIIVNLVTKAKK